MQNLDARDAQKAARESKFSTMTRFIVRRELHPSFPVCLIEWNERLTISKCGDVYCTNCMLSMLSDGKMELAEVGPTIRCAICRYRSLSKQSVQVLQRLHDRPGPNETEVAVTR